MKRQDRNTLALLVFVHLVIFVFPWASKTFHRHHFQNKNYNYTHQSDGVQIIQQPDECLIWNYELFSFVAKEPFSLDIQCFAYPVTVPALPEKLHLAPILHFSLRAPPVA